ncbi:DUF4396 domain-containing protein [Streptomyces sp. NPDC093089]|uniref:DUF4396 domain-containing protein n=1 Tax=Streptomyces sp. NPDC093089 TaxID=3366024 RepID=UPI00381E8B1E
MLLDGVGFLVAAVITYNLGVQLWTEILVEYVLGFLFGWTVFQALFHEEQVRHLPRPESSGT